MRLSWIRAYPSNGTPKPPHLPLVLHTAFCPLPLLLSGPVSNVLHLRSLWFLPYYLMWRSFPSPTFPPFFLFLVISLPRDCSDSLLRSFFDPSHPVCLSLRSSFVKPSLSPPPYSRPIIVLPPLPLFPLYQHFLYSTHHLLFYSPSVHVPRSQRKSISRLFFRSRHAHITPRFTPLTLGLPLYPLPILS